MNRQMKRASLANGRKMQKLPWNAFKDVTEEALYKHRILNPGSTYRPDKVFQNNKFIVQLFYHREMLGHICTKAMIRRSDAEKVLEWGDIQRIKNEIFGENAEGFQMFPKQSNLTDVANIYWLYVIKEMK